MRDAIECRQLFRHCFQWAAREERARLALEAATATYGEDSDECAAARKAFDNAGTNLSAAVFELYDHIQAPAAFPPALPVRT